MRKEASLEQWKALYEVTTRIKEMKPWERLWDLDIIGIQNGKEEDTVFFSIMGRGGDCYGIVVYEGYEGLNKFLMLTMQEHMNLSTKYVMFNQRNLTCYWGNRDELTDKQRKVIKDIGYKYRGQNQWLYFVSYEPGYFPFNLDEDEVLRMTQYMEDLEFALHYYYEYGADVSFDNGNMFLFSFGEDKRTWSFGEKPLPFTAFQFGSLQITNDELLEELATVKKNKMVLEVDICPMGVSVSDKKFKRPANPTLCLIGDSVSEMIMACEMTEPADDPMVILADKLIDYIFQCGAPKEIRISNIIIEAGLEQICDVCGIKLRRVKKLAGLESFIAGMHQFM